MYCGHCGKQGNGRFCTACGRALDQLPLAQEVDTESLDVTGHMLAAAPVAVAARDFHPVGASVAAPSPSYLPPAPATNVTVNVAGPQLLYQDQTGPGLLVRALWFLFIGWYLGFFWILLASTLNATIIGLPLGIMMFNALPKVMTLRPRNVRMQVTANADGTYTLTRAHLEQRPFWARAVYFLLIGWWFSVAWALTAYVIGLLIVTLPISFWMFDRVPALTTLARY